MTARTRELLRWMMRLSLLASVTVAAVSAEDPELIAEASTFLHVADGETVLEIEGLGGEIAVRTGKGDELRFMAVSLEDRRREVTVSLWRDGRKLRILPSGEGDAVPVLLEVSVPSSFELRMDLASSVAKVRALRGPVEILGDNLEVDLRSLRNNLYLDLRNGEVRAFEIGGRVDLRGEDLRGSLAGAGADLLATLTGGEFLIKDVAGEAEIDLRNVRFGIEGVGGEFKVESEGGSARIAGLEKGGEFRLEGTVLELQRCKGDLDIETDAEVRFQDNESLLHVNSWGGSLRGSGNKGLLEIKTERAEIEVEQLEGPVRIQGEGLNARVRNIIGDLAVYCESSTIEVEGVDGEVYVENEFGDVSIVGATKKVQVMSRDGDVNLQSILGPVHVEAEGALVTVAWKALNHPEDSYIENARGDVSIVLPGSGGCGLDIRAGYGGIESSLADLPVDDGIDTIRGSFGGRETPSIQVESGGKVRLEATASQ